MYKYQVMFPLIIQHRLLCSGTFDCYTRRGGNKHKICFFFFVGRRGVPEGGSAVGMLSVERPWLCMPTHESLDRGL